MHTTNPLSLEREASHKNSYHSCSLTSLSISFRNAESSAIVPLTKVTAFMLTRSRINNCADWSVVPSDEHFWDAARKVIMQRKKCRVTPIHVQFLNPQIHKLEKLAAGTSGCQLPTKRIVLIVGNDWLCSWATVVAEQFHDNTNNGSVTHSPPDTWSDG